jgi:neopullulanase
MRVTMKFLFSLIALSVLAGTLQAETLRITSIDPPNWYAQLPKPMLLVHGQGLKEATFTLSDTALSIEKTVTSQNGHYAQLWLSASPSQPETIEIRVQRGADHLDARYSFAARRFDGMAGFSSSDVLYLIMTDRFADGDLSNDGPEANLNAVAPDALSERAKPRGWHGGDLRGILQHLNYLQQLGVTALWITPVYENHEAESYHGYGATNLYRVDEHYGKLADLQMLAVELHRRGMKLVLDTVPNHVGPEHPWVYDEPAPNWFHGTPEHHLKAESNFRALIDPAAPASEKAATLEGWFADRLPDMNTDDPAVAKYLRQNVEWWIEQTGADALRIDTFPYVNRSFWNAFNGELAELYPHLTQVGEVFNGDPVITSAFAGGVTRAGVDTRLYTPFDFPTYFALRDVFSKGAPMSKLADVVANDKLYPHPERLVPFIGNHDTSRFASAETAPASEALAFAYILTSRGMPQMYSGDELAMTGGEDPDNRRDFPGGFPHQNGNAFDVAGRTQEQQQMFTWVSSLTHLRAELPALQCGKEQVLSSDADSIVYVRSYSGTPSEDCMDHRRTLPSQRVLVAIHRNAAVKLAVPLANTEAASCVLGSTLMATPGSHADITGNTLHLDLPLNSVQLVLCQ